MKGFTDALGRFQRAQHDLLSRSFHFIASLGVTPPPPLDPSTAGHLLGRDPDPRGGRGTARWPPGASPERLVVYIAPNFY